MDNASRVINNQQEGRPNTMNGTRMDFSLPAGLRRVIDEEAAAICADPWLLAAVDMVLTEVLLVAERVGDQLEAEGNPHAGAFARLLPLVTGMFRSGGEVTHAQVMCVFVGSALGARFAARAVAEDGA
jgi:hypothetical protein